MKAVIYARFSSEKQNEASIEGQLRECLEYAKYNNIEIVGHYIDRAQSAKTDNRPDFQRMIKDSYKNMFNAIIVWKLDRFARNRYDSAYYKNVLRKNGVRVMSAKETISQGADGILFESILEGYAEYYSAELAEKVKRGMTENALKLKSNGVRAPFGYYVDENDNYQIDERLAPIVKEIFALYNDGVMIKEIITLMNNRGVKNKGYPLTHRSVLRLLNNRKYMGEYKFGEVLIPNGIPAIVTEEEFELAQKRIVKNKKAGAALRNDHEYILTTKLFCGECGALMTAASGLGRSKKWYKYYRCNRAKAKICKKKTVSKEWIEDLVITEIMNMLSSEKVILELADRIYEIQNADTTTSATLKRQIVEVEKKINNLIEAMSQGIFSQTTKKVLDELEQQKINLEEELQAAEIKNPLLTKDQILFALHSYKKLDLKTHKGRVKLVDSFINSIYLFDDRLIITFNYKSESKTISFSEIFSLTTPTTGSPLIT